VIVADTGGIVALVDRDDPDHAALRARFLDDPSSWVVPWIILAEVDHLLRHHVGSRPAALFLDDIAHGRYRLEAGREEDLQRADELCRQYASLDLGLVDGAVIATAERLRARAIATLDLRDFGAIRIRGNPALLPRDLG